MVVIKIDEAQVVNTFARVWYIFNERSTFYFRFGTTQFTVYYTECV
jgi:hypothetical protein